MDPTLTSVTEIKEKVRCCVSARVPSSLRFNLNSKEIIKPEHELGEKFNRFKQGRGCGSVDRRPGFDPQSCINQVW